MLLYGNTSSQLLIQSFFDRIKIQWISHPFLIVSGPQHCGKTTCLLNHIRSLIKPHESDFLYIQDYSELLGKPHTIKIEMSKKKEEQRIRLPNGTYYKDIWVREIQERYQKWALWTYKVVFIEHIERMSISWANALLKTLEESQKNHIVIATTKEYDRILPTIRSRWLTIKRNLLTDKDIRTIIWQIDIQIEDIDMIISYSQWAPGKCLRAIQHIPQIHLFIEKAHNIRLGIISWELISFIQCIKEISKEWQLVSMFDFLLYQECSSNRPNNKVINVLTTYKKYQHISINQEHLLLYALLQSREN